MRYRLWGLSHNDLHFFTGVSDSPYVCVDNLEPHKATNFMGDRLSFHGMTTVQLQAHIRRLAKDSQRVVITLHAYDRMSLRCVTDWEVYECLRKGVIQRPPQVDRKTGSLKCRMEYFGTVRNLAVVAALEDDDPDVIVVTVMTKTR